MERLALVRENQELRTRLRALEEANSSLALETEAGQAHADATKEYMLMMAAAEAFEKEVLGGNGSHLEAAGGDGTLAGGGVEQDLEEKAEERHDAQRFSRLDLLFSMSSRGPSVDNTARSTVSRGRASSPSGESLGSSGASVASHGTAASAPVLGSATAVRAPASVGRHRSNDDVARASEIFSQQVVNAARGFSEAKARGLSVDRSSSCSRGHSIRSTISSLSNDSALVVENKGKFALDDAAAAAAASATTTTGPEGRWVSPTWFIRGWDKPTDELAAKLAKRALPDEPGQSTASPGGETAFQNERTERSAPVRPSDDREVPGPFAIRVRRKPSEVAR